jgi:hypothetical protein
MSRRQVGGRTEIITDAIRSARPTDKGGLDAMSRVVDLLWVRERPEPRKPTGAAPVLPAGALTVRPSIYTDCGLLEPALPRMLPPGRLLAMQQYSALPALMPRLFCGAGRSRRAAYLPYWFKPQAELCNDW